MMIMKLIKLYHASFVKHTFKSEFLDARKFMCRVSPVWCNNEVAPLRQSANALGPTANAASSSRAQRWLNLQRFRVYRGRNQLFLPPWASLARLHFKAAQRISHL